MALMSYTSHDKHGTYYFRKAIPPRLRAFMPEPWTGKVEWKRTLNTKMPAEAKVRVARALSDCTADFQAAERAKRGEPPITLATTRFDAALLSELEAGALRSVLADDEAERSVGDDRRYLQTPEEREQYPLLVPVPFGRKGMMDDHFEVLGDNIREDAERYRKALGRNNPSIVSSELRQALRPYDLLGKLTPDEEHEAGLAVLKGTVRAYGMLMKRQEGEVVETPKPAADKGPKLSEAFAAWMAGGSAKGARKPGDNTVREAKHAVRRFLEWHGDMRLGDITREKAREFRDALSAVPTRLKRNLLKLPLRAILKHPDAVGPPAHAGTINKSLTLLSAVVTHATREGRLDRIAGFVNPFDKGIKLALDARDADGRQIFEAADLKAIFSTGVYTDAVERPTGGGGEASFWLPLLALMTGARQGELAQLRIADLKQDPETGIWYLDISTEGGRSIKTVTSRRKVPLHPVLEAVGLLRYRQSLIDAGSGLEASLWPDMQSDSSGRKAGPWSKWFNRWIRDEAEVPGDGKVFHSFRHGFKRFARDAGLTEEQHDALTGHAGGGVGRDYGRGFGLAALAVAIAQIKTPAAAAALRWEPGEKPKRRPPRVPKVKLTPRQPKAANAVRKSGLPPNKKAPPDHLNVREPGAYREAAAGGVRPDIKG